MSEHWGLAELAEAMQVVSRDLAQTGHDFDKCWAQHLEQDRKGLLLLAATTRHLGSGVGVKV